MARNENTGKQVWSADKGYPGNPAYREFHKKDEQSGLHYWRVTGAKVDLGDKAEYDPGVASAVVAEQAEHFRDLVKRERVLPDEQVDEVLDLRKMTEIGVPGGAHGMVAGG